MIGPIGSSYSAASTVRLPADRSKVSPFASFMTDATASASSSSTGNQLSISAEAQTKANALTTGSTSSGVSKSDTNFASMTNADFLSWGKQQYAEGKLTLDDLFQVQMASGSFNSLNVADPAQAASNQTSHSAASSQDFMKYFQDAVSGEISRGGQNDPKSPIGVYKHILSAMAGQTSGLA